MPMTRDLTDSILGRVTDEQVLALEQAAIRIPSTTFEEQRIADHFANYMSNIGLKVEMLEVTHPAKPGTRLKGDGLVCPAFAHKLGGAGTRALLKHGVRTDLAINMEHSANTIASVCVGVVMIHVKTRAPELFFRYSAEAKAAYWNP